MTLQEQSIADDKMRVEIAKLVAETSEINQNMKYRFWVLMAAYVSAMGILLNRYSPCGVRLDVNIA